MSVLGFVVMVVGAMLFVSGRPGRSTATAGRGSAGDGPGAQPGSSLHARMEERFRHRFDHLDEQLLRAPATASRAPGAGGRRGCSSFAERAWWALSIDRQYLCRTESRQGNPGILGHLRPPRPGPAGNGSWKEMGMRTRARSIVLILVLLWLVIGALAAYQRGYFQGSADTCAQTSTILITVLAGPLNYLGVNPKIECAVPQPSP